MGSAGRLGSILFLFLLIHSSIALSATYTVTSGYRDGPGSLREAVEAANANPGKDRIEFDASLSVITPTRPVPSGFGDAGIVITDSVEIIGPGAASLSLSDDVAWATPSGHINAGLACDAGNIVGRAGTTPILVNGNGVVEVLIKGLKFTKNFGVIKVNNSSASVTLEDVDIDYNYSGPFECYRPLISAVGQLNMTNVSLESNVMTDKGRTDAIVVVKGGLRLEKVKMYRNRSKVAVYSWYDGSGSDRALVRESEFDSGISFAGMRADIVNSLFFGESHDTGVQGWNSAITLINSTISLPQRIGKDLSVSGQLYDASHVWIEGTGAYVTLFNTVVDGSVGGSTGALPFVGGAAGTTITAAADSHITDGSGPAGPTSGDANLRGFYPQAAPSLEGGDDGSAFDPELGLPLQPLATDLAGSPRIQGPAVDKGAFEVLENFSRDDQYTVTQDTLFDSGAASVLDNDTTYTANATKTATLVTPPTRGTLNFNSDGTFTYQPEQSDYGSRAFTYYMSVNGAAANTATVILDIQRPYPIYTRPDRYTINQDTQLKTDTNNGPLSNDDLMAFIYASLSRGTKVTLVDPPDHAATGGFDLPRDGIFTYTPAPGFVGTDTFTYQVWFEKLGVAGSAETTVTIEVLSTNQPPVALDDAYTAQSRGVVVDAKDGPLANDSDPDGNSLIAVKKSDPSHGSVFFFSDGAFSYFPNDPTYVGTDSFTYAASDGKAESNIATVTLTIKPINNPPLAQPDKYRLPAASLLAVPERGGVLRNDKDPDGDPLSVVLTRGVANGTLSLQANGAFSYEPHAGFTGVDVFEYALTDGTDSTSGIVTLIVSALNQPPVANPETYSVVEGTTLTVPAPSILANDSDPEGHELSAVNLQTPLHGKYSFDPNGAFIYTPDPGFTGEDILGYQVSDGELQSNPTAAIIRVTPAPVNLPPVAHDDAWVMQQDTFLKVDPPGVLANDSDPEGHSLTATLLSTPAPGVFTAIAGGGFSYQPPTGFAGQVSFTYKVSDGHSDSAPATGVITVNAVNHAPVAHNDAYAVNAGLTLDIQPKGLLTNDSDPDGDALTVIPSGPPSHGLLSNDGKGGFQYSPVFGFTGVDSFTYKVSDGSLESSDATVQITVSGLNRAPVALNDAWSMAQDTVLNVAPAGALANDGDPEGHALTMAVTGQPAHGQLSPHPDGSFTYVPNPGYFGTDSFTYRANDGLIDSNEATVLLTINEVNLPPVANNDAYATPQDTVLNVAAAGILANDSDPEGHALTVTVTGQPSHGHLSLGAGGAFSYTPDAGYFGSDSFTYTVSDGALDSNTATVQLTINEVNLPPVANNDAYATPQDTVLNVAAAGILANDSDPEGHALTVTVTGQPSHGHLSLGAGGAFSYTPDAGYFGSDSFTYTVSDGALDSNTATVQLTIDEVNLPPVANDDSFKVSQGNVLQVPPPGVLGNDLDPEGHQLSAELLTQPTHGHLVPVNGGGFDYYPDAGFFGQDSFTYRVSDGKLLSQPATVRITVAQIYRDPTIPVPLLGGPGLVFLMVLILAAAAYRGRFEGKA